MRDFLKLFGKTAVALFVAWHMAAVFVFSIPLGQSDAVSGTVRDFLRPRVAPYLFATSQWQQWDLFAPDPLRAVITYSVDTEDGTRWKTAAAIEPDTFPWWRHATYAKLLPALLQKERNDLDVFRERFLQMMCNDLDIPENTLIRLRENRYLIPYLERHGDKKTWDAWTPDYETTVMHTTNCHPSAL